MDNRAKKLEQKALKEAREKEAKAKKELEKAQKLAKKLRKKEEAERALDEKAAEKLRKRFSKRSSVVQTQQDIEPIVWEDDIEPSYDSERQTTISRKDSDDRIKFERKDSKGKITEFARRASSKMLGFTRKLSQNNEEFTRANSDSRLTVKPIEERLATIERIADCIANPLTSVYQREAFSILKEFLQKAEAIYTSIHRKHKVSHADGEVINLGNVIYDFYNKLSLVLSISEEDLNAIRARAKATIDGFRSQTISDFAKSVADQLYPYEIINLRMEDDQKNDLVADFYDQEKIGGGDFGAVYKVKPIRRVLKDDDFRAIPKMIRDRQNLLVVKVEQLDKWKEKLTETSDALKNATTAEEIEKAQKNDETAKKNFEASKEARNYDLRINAKLWRAIQLDPTLDRHFLPFLPVLNEHKQFMLVGQFAPRGDLKNYLLKLNRDLPNNLSKKNAIALCLKVMQFGLDWQHAEKKLHDLGIMHLDATPSNFLVDFDYSARTQIEGDPLTVRINEALVAKLTDFGWSMPLTNVLENPNESISRYTLNQFRRVSFEHINYQNNLANDVFMRKVGVLDLLLCTVGIDLDKVLRADKYHPKMAKFAGNNDLLLRDIFNFAQEEIKNWGRPALLSAAVQAMLKILDEAHFFSWKANATPVEQREFANSCYLTAMQEIQNKLPTIVDNFENDLRTAASSRRGSVVENEERYATGSPTSLRRGKQDLASVPPSPKSSPRNRRDSATTTLLKKAITKSVSATSEDSLLSDDSSNAEMPVEKRPNLHVDNEIHSAEERPEKKEDIVYDLRIGNETVVNLTLEELEEATSDSGSSHSSKTTSTQGSPRSSIVDNSDSENKNRRGSIQYVAELRVDERSDEVEPIAIDEAPDAPSNRRTSITNRKASLSMTKSHKHLTHFKPQNADQLSVPEAPQNASDQEKPAFKPEQ